MPFSKNRPEDKIRNLMHVTVVKRASFPSKIAAVNPALGITTSNTNNHIRYIKLFALVEKFAFTMYVTQYVTQYFQCGGM